MIFDFNSIFAYVFGLAAVYICCWLFARPLRWLFKLTINVLLGGVVIILINMVGGFAGISLPVNPINAALAGIFGIPGVAGAFLLHLIVT